MLVEEILMEMSLAAARDFTSRANKLIRRRMRIEVVFTKHFLDNCVDGTIDSRGVDRGSMITYDEAWDMFERAIKQNWETMRSEQVMSNVFYDPKTDINIAFKMYIHPTAHKKMIYFLTIMKERNFRTNINSPKIIVN